MTAIKTEVVKAKPKPGPKHHKGGYETSIYKPGFRPTLPEDQAENQNDIDRVT